jgi:superfamily I DNA/RNA helicase
VDDTREIQRLRLSRSGQQELPTARIDWAAELNEQQLAAVRAPDGPVLVLAGAGSGKTRVITYRVAYLISERRIRPQQIMLATFTNKAARSMLKRCEEVIGRAARDVTGGTFHHIANLLLRRYAKALEYQSNFTILDEADSRSMMKVCRTESGVDTKTVAFPSDRVLTAIASAIVNTNTDLDTLLVRRYPHLYERRDDIERVLITYHERKQASNQMDFDDLLVNLYRLLSEHPRIRNALARRYLHVLVDEYQDVNHLQAKIVRELYLGETADTGSAADQDTAVADEYPALDDYDDFSLKPPEPAAGQMAEEIAERAEPAEPGDSTTRGAGGAPARESAISEAESAIARERGLFVVGDDAQSIYSFRGADYTNIRNFPDAFPTAHVYKLEVNYRSVPQILTLANGILDEADPLFHKELTPVKPSAPERPLLLACRDAEEQAEFVAEQTIKLREDGGLSWSEMAVLYRAHNNRLEIELEFSQRGIPFIVRGGLRFFEQAHIKDLVSYLVVLANGRDELAWQRMLGMANRVGPKTIATVLNKLRDASAEDGGPLARFTHNGVADTARGQGKASLIELRDFLRELGDKVEELPPAELIQRIITERYRGYMELKFENWQQRLEDLEQLMIFAGRFDTLVGFLTEVGLNGSFSGGQLQEGYTDEDREEGAVTLSTIHQAKGLEWNAVFVVHVQDDVIPHRLSQGDSSAEDEERRLLYVAVTRAEEMLFLSFPQVTVQRDFQRLINKPSRFLDGRARAGFDEAVLDWE